MNNLKLNICTIILGLICIVSCKDEEIGRTTPPKFDKELFVFSASQKDTVLVCRNKKSWFFDDLFIQDKSIPFKDIKYYANAPGLADNDLGYIYKFENDWFIIEKIDKVNIKISLKENIDNMERNMSFVTSVGNAGTRIKIKQKAK